MRVTRTRVPSHRRLIASFLLLVLPPASIAAVGAVAAAAPGAATSVVEAERAVTRARQARAAAASELAAAERDRAAAEARVGDLDRRDAALVAELAQARQKVREYAVEAYIDGGRTELYLATLAPDEAGSVAWRTGLVAGSTIHQGRSVERYEAMREETEPERVAAATELDRARDAEDRARSAFLQASAVERDAEVALAEAKAEQARIEAERAAEAQRQRAAAAAAAATARRAQQASSGPAAASGGSRSTAPAPVGAIGDATPQELALLARIRHCESRGNYSAVSASGRYRGAYQFSVATWRAMGGTGDPAAASPAEQDHRALLLLRRQGPRAWPVCSTR